METMDRAMLAEWLDLDLDGALEGPEKARFDERLAQDDDLAAEHRRTRALHALIAESRVGVREGFRARTMAALPVPAWGARTPAWMLPLAMMTTFAAAAGLLLARGLPEHPALGALAAVAEFLQATALAGAGLLDASWRGLGLGLQQLFADSGTSLLAMAVLVLFMNLLWISLMRRRPHDVRPLLERAAIHPDDESGRPL